jgi:hypothetical protein
MTASNSHGQSMPYPPFGMPSICFEPHHISSQTKSDLRRFYFHLCTATAATALLPVDHRNKVHIEMQNRNRAKAPKGSFVHAADERNKRSPRISISGCDGYLGRPCKNSTLQLSPNVCILLNSSRKAGSVAHREMEGARTDHHHGRDRLI